MAIMSNNIPSASQTPDQEEKRWELRLYVAGHPPQIAGDLCQPEEPQPRNEFPGSFRLSLRDRGHNTLADGIAGKAYNGWGLGDITAPSRFLQATRTVPAGKDTASSFLIRGEWQVGFGRRRR